MLNPIRDFILRHQRFLITSHVRPDGDSLGTSLALALALLQIGKTAEVVHRDRRPQTYSFLPHIDLIRLQQKIEESYDAVVLLECENYPRSGLEGVDRFVTINIDHHPKNNRYGQYNWVNEKAAAVAEMVYELISALEVELTPEIATNLFVAILTDTGSFQFSNTSSKTFEIAAELVRSGADPGRISRLVYMNQPLSRLRLLGTLLNSMEIHPSGRIAWIHLTDQMIQDTGAAAGDSEGIANYPLSVEGVVASAFFRQEGKSHFRVSLRSKNAVDVGRVAARFGGGGHLNASGCSLDGSFETVRDQIVTELEKLVE